MLEDRLQPECRGGSMCAGAAACVQVPPGRCEPMEGQLSPQVLSFGVGWGGLQEAEPRGNLPEVRVTGLSRPPCALLAWAGPHSACFTSPRASPTPVLLKPRCLLQVSAPSRWSGKAPRSDREGHSGG